MPSRALIGIVDDDESVRESLPDLLRRFGFDAEAFASAEAFLSSEYVDRVDCLLLDVAMPGMDGPGLQKTMADRRPATPIVFITAHADETVRPTVLQAGAVDCLFKPFSATALRAAVDAALRME